MSYLYPIPSTFDEFIIHRAVADRLRVYYSIEELPLSTVLYGIPLIGKRTCIHALIRHVIGQPFETRIKKDSIYTHGNTMNIEFAVSHSHIEFHLEEYGLTDRYIVGEYIQRIVDAPTIDDRIRIYVIHGIDTYTYETQDMFVNIIEKHTSSARFIFTSNTFNRLHNRLVSISQPYRIGFPTRIELVNYLKSTKSLNMLQIEDTVNKIIEDGNLGRLRYKDMNFNKPIDIVWESIRPLIDRRDLLSIYDMKPHIYNVVTLTIPSVGFIYKMRDYVVQNIPAELNEKDRVHYRQEIHSEFTRIEESMKDVDYDIIGLEYAALISKRYLHVVFALLKDKLSLGM